MHLAGRKEAHGRHPPHLPPRSHAVISALSVNASGRRPLPTIASSRATASSKRPALAAALMSVLKVMALGAARALPDEWCRCMMRNASFARSTCHDCMTDMQAMRACVHGDEKKEWVYNIPSIHAHAKILHSEKHTTPEHLAASFTR